MLYLYALCIFLYKLIYFFFAKGIKLMQYKPFNLYTPLFFRKGDFYTRIYTPRNFFSAPSHLYSTKTHTQLLNVS